MNFNVKVLESLAIVTLTAIALFMPSCEHQDKTAEKQKSETPAKVENTATKVPPSFVEVSQITADMKGMTKNTRGVVTILNEKKGNVYFNLKDPTNGKEIRCVLFAKTNNDDHTRKAMLLDSRENNSVVNIKGEVDIYKGELEIKVWQIYLKTGT